MAHVIIRNVGPVTEVEFDLNKINVIIGPQSSGKSTIDKIACYCSWVEKKASLDQSFDFFLKDDNFIKELVRFHKIEGYFNPSSFIAYKSEVISIEYHHQPASPKIEWVDKYAFQNSKIAYIPAERNIVAAVPNWFDVKLVDNNILSYMKDWAEARQVHTRNQPFEVLDMDVSYYYEGGNDYVQVGADHSLLLTNASSGCQSLIPLQVLLHYLTGWIYQHDLPTSVEKSNKISQLSRMLIKDVILSKVKVDVTSIEKIIPFIDELTKAEGSSELGVLRNNWSNIWKKFNKYGYSRFFIEEPEQNLFPKTQMELIYTTLASLNRADRDHQLFITTHSPYILYALNNCMLGGLVGDNIPADMLSEIPFRGSFIDPKKVSVWEIKDGRFNPYDGQDRIQDEDGLIRRNYFDGIMKELMKDFNLLFNFYEPDDE